MGRARRVAVLSVPASAYEKALSDFLLSPPVLPLRTRLGVLVTDFRAITPSAVEACAAAVLALLKIGLVTAVMQLAKAETAFRRILAANIALLGVDKSADTLAAAAATHLQCVFSMLRSVKTEEEGLGRYKWKCCTLVVAWKLWSISCPFAVFNVLFL